MRTIYDVAHNIGKLETYDIDGKKKKLLVHRKGATRAFGSACHGAGRAMSRHAARLIQSGEQVRRELLDQGILVSTGKRSGLSEEAPYAYKDIDDVIGAVSGASLAKKVARLRPIAVIKGD